MCAIVKNNNNHATWKIGNIFARKKYMCLSLCTQNGNYALSRTCQTGTQSINFKARFCADGYSQEVGINFKETHSPVVKWNTMCTFLTEAMKNNWHAKATDFDQSLTHKD